MRNLNFGSDSIALKLKVDTARGTGGLALEQPSKKRPQSTFQVLRGDQVDLD